MWINSIDGSLVNLAYAYKINVSTNTNGAHIEVDLGNNSFNRIASFSTREKAQKALIRITNAIRANTKLLDMTILASQVENEP